MTSITTLPPRGRVQIDPVGNSLTSALVYDHPDQVLRDDALAHDLDTPDDLNDPRVASFVARLLGHDITEGRPA